MLGIITGIERHPKNSIPRKPKNSQTHLHSRNAPSCPNIPDTFKGDTGRADDSYFVKIFRYGSDYKKNF